MEIINVNKIVNRIFEMSGIGRIIKIKLKEEKNNEYNGYIYKVNKIGNPINNEEEKDEGAMW